MKKWLSKMFGGPRPSVPQSHASGDRPPKAAAPPPPAASPPAGGDAVTQPGSLSSEAAGPGATLLASASQDPQAFQAAEARISAEWKVGDVILDLYEVKHVHQGGGMGLVYRVHHRGWNTDLAVKSPRANYFQTESQKENFTRECETWINLGLHPHIVSCHYVRTLGGVPRVFVEYVEGGSLKEWIDSRKLYEGGPQEALKRVLDIAIQMAWGLHYAHEQGLIHQDVKPANVMMMPDGTAKVADFGLAKARSVAEESSMPEAGRSIFISSGGMTPAYCSPEQANQQPLSRKTDIWSWAVSVLEMLVGEVCWRSGTAAPELLKRLSEMKVEGVGLAEPPSELLRLLERCFALEPAGRPENFRVLADGLWSIYHTIASEDYGRAFPEAAEARADALNNRAVSMLDLRRVAEAEKLFDQALALHPGHPQTTYNQGLNLWRTGRGTDDMIVKALEQARTNRPRDWSILHLLGLIHLERRDAESAVIAMSAAERLTGNAELRQVLAEARRMESRTPERSRAFERHKGAVNAVVFSADGRLALSGSHDKTLRLWEVSSGQCLRTFEGHTREVSSVALTADGRCALSGSWDGTLRLWNLSTGECVRTFAGHSWYVESLAVSADGRWALSGSADKTLRLWEVRSGKCVRTFAGHLGAVNSVALSPDGGWAWSGGMDNSLRQWEVSSGKCLRTFEGLEGGVCSVAASADGRWVSALSGDHHKTLRLWEVSSGRCLKTIEARTDKLGNVVLSADGRWAVLGSADDTLRLWELGSGKCLRTFEEHAGGVFSVALSTDGRQVLSGSGDGTLIMRNISGFWDGCSSVIAPLMVCRSAGAEETLDVQKRFRALVGAARKAVADEDYSHAWSLAAESRTLAGYEVSSEMSELACQAGLRGTRAGLHSGRWERALEGHTGWVSSAAVSLDGRLALSGSFDKTLRLWEVGSGKCLRTFEGHTDKVSSVALSADGGWALSGSWDKTLRLWEVSTGKCWRTFEGHTEGVSSVVLSADGNWVLSGGRDNTLRLWEVNSGKCLRKFEGHTGWLNSVVLSADVRWALSGSGDKTLRLWELSSGKCLRTFEGHASGVSGVWLSADGRRAMSIGGILDKTLRLWEVGSGKCLRTFEGHTSGVFSLTLSADERWALSGSYDKSVRLWEVGSGKCVRALEGHTNHVASLAVSADGRWVVSGGADHTLRVWGLEWNYEFPKRKDWDEGAMSFLEIFLARRCALGEDGFTRAGRPAWNEGEFQELLLELQYRGYGWLRPDGVRRQLEKMAAKWQGPPSMQWESTEPSAISGGGPASGGPQLTPPEGDSAALRDRAASFVEAVEHGDFEKVKALLNENSELVFVKNDKYGTTPLHVGVGHKAVMELLLASKAEVDAKAGNGMTPLDYAVVYDRKDVAELLLANKADVNAKDNNGNTPLHLGTLKRRRDIAELLVANSADVNARNNAGDTPLHLAALAGQNGMTQWLLDCEAEVNSRNNAGATPLHWAADGGGREVVELLLAGNAEVSPKSHNGNTPLHLAVLKGHQEVAELLVANKADVSARDKNGQTPLYCAVQEGRRDLAEFLLANKAEVNVKDNNGNTPLHMAANDGRKDMAKLLLDHNAEINAGNNDAWKWTPLHYAVKLGHKDVVELLLDHKADVNARSADGRTALRVAMQDGHHDIAALLQHHGGLQ